MSKSSIKKIKWLVFVLLFLGGVFFYLLPQAQAINLQGSYPDWFPLEEISEKPNVLGELVNGIFNVFLVLAGLAAFVMIVLGGVKYLTSAGDPSKMGDAQNQIFAAILGLIILFSSWLILNTINPELVELREPGLEVPIKEVEPVTAKGACLEGKSYDVELFSKKNYNERFMCLEAGEERPKITSEIRSIRINNSAIKLFEEPNFGGRNICFRRSYPDIMECPIACSGDGDSWYNWCGDTWEDDVSSLMIISPAGCSNEGKTLDEDGRLTKPKEKCDGF